MSVDEAHRNLLDNKKAEEKEREERALYESLRELAKSQAVAEVKENVTTSKPATPMSTGAGATAKTGMKMKNIKKPSQLKQVKESKPEILEIENGCFDIPSQSLEDVDEMILSSDEEDYASDVDEEECGQEALDVAMIPNQEEEEEVVYIPAPRAPSSQKICFSQRIFPTPARESKLGTMSIVHGSEVLQIFSTTITLVFNSG